MEPFLFRWLFVKIRRRVLLLITASDIHFPTSLMTLNVVVFFFALKMGRHRFFIISTTVLLDKKNPIFFVILKCEKIHVLCNYSPW